MIDETELARGVHAAIARLARTMHGRQSGDLDPEQLLLEVTEAAVRLLPGVQHSGVTLVDNRHRVRSTAATGPVPRLLDELQEHHRQGPCLSAIREHHTVRVDDFGSEARWPDFVAAAVANTAVRSVLSIQLYTDASELGALNLYSEQPETFTFELEQLALAIAAHAAIGLSTARRGDQFHSALASRDIIGQAKGILMERFDVNAIAAFNLLVKLSQERNEPVTDIASALVDKDHPLPA
jgi:GAF domain-containing protein